VIGTRPSRRSKRFGDDGGFLADWANSERMRALTQADAGRLGEALAGIERAVDLLSRLGAADPANVEYLELLRQTKEERTKIEQRHRGGC